MKQKKQQSTCREKGKYEIRKKHLAVNRPGPKQKAFFNNNIILFVQKILTFILFIQRKKKQIVLTGNTENK